MFELFRLYISSFRLGEILTNVPPNRLQSSARSLNLQLASWEENQHEFSWLITSPLYGNGSKPLISIFGRINSHKPAIVGYLGYQGFDSFPYFSKSPSSAHYVGFDLPYTLNACGYIRYTVLRTDRPHITHGPTQSVPIPIVFFFGP
jgi:hypothetical protein